MNLTEKILELGAYRAGQVACAGIVCNGEFRKACESNACGMYGRCWMCPPLVGPVERLMEQLREYDTAVVYQTVHSIEDSFDIEGMLEAGALHNALAQSISDVLLAELPRQSWLHLGAGGCRLCPRCAKQENLPCRFPERALASLEAYGVSVSELAELAEMRYINGQNTVTYFGAVLLRKG